MGSALVYAVPFFLGMMILEAFLTWRKGNPVYSFRDTFANLSCGMGSQLIGLAIAGMTAVAYLWVQRHVALFGLSASSPLTWIFAILAVDFIYYWWHRWSHVVNVLWATHVVHHQSEEYNLSVALRQSWFGNATSFVFYLPLAAIGVPLEVYVASYSLNLLYQFLIHTKAIDKLGPLEWVLNTPSHHRVHHGSNEIYLDKNFAGILILWDRLFGTFQGESEPVEFGLVKPLRSFNPIWANAHHWVDLARGPLLAWVKNPGWIPGDTSTQDAIVRARGRTYEKYRVAVTRPRMVVVVLETAAVLVCTVLVMSGVELPANASWAIYAIPLLSTTVGSLSARS